MYASDFSPASRPAFKKAIELSKSSGARLLIVHARPPVISPLMGEGVYVSPATWNEIEVGARRAAQRQIARLLQEAKGRESMRRDSSSRGYPRTGSGEPPAPGAPIF
jgi:nucleotide-binding universal stress UspA family protein